MRSRDNSITEFSPVARTKVTAHPNGLNVPTCQKRYIATSAKYSQRSTRRSDFEILPHNAQQQSAIKTLAALVKEQAAQIQKVSAQLEVSKSVPQTVLNNQ
jgi:hypothetical protein